MNQPPPRNIWKECFNTTTKIYLAFNVFVVVLTIILIACIPVKFHCDTDSVKGTILSISNIKNSTVCTSIDSFLICNPITTCDIAFVFYVNNVKYEEKHSNDWACYETPGTDIKVYYNLNDPSSCSLKYTEYMVYCPDEIHELKYKPVELGAVLCAVETAVIWIFSTICKCD